MGNNLVEACGYLLMIGFLWFVWPPLVLLGAGVLLVAVANARARAQSGRPRRSVLTALGAAAAAYRQATTTGDGSRDLRRVV